MKFQLSERRQAFEIINVNFHYLPDRVLPGSIQHALQCMPTTVSLISTWLEKALKSPRSVMVVLWSVTLMTPPAVGE